MPKSYDRTVFVCSSCGEEYLQWQGKCSVCGEWNTLKEFKVAKQGSSSVARTFSQNQGTARKLQDIVADQTKRDGTGLPELDRVLGGGLVPGSVILLGGDPGIGKSTLLLQFAGLAQRTVLYCSGEESAEQIKMRADRLGVTSATLQLAAESDVNTIESLIIETKPAFVIVDSIQTAYDPAFPSTPGSIVQVRETAIRLQQIAKRAGIPVILVGHITKEGTVAGPRTLEHLVDVVLYLEGDGEHDLRVLRAVKNRFGDVSETGLFTMTEQGLQEVRNPTSFLLQERIEAPGSVLSVVLEGSRPVLIEIQALTVPTVFGYPRRTASGIDLNRLNLLLAVLQRRANVDLSNHDVFVNIVGGLKVKDPGVDAAVCVALASARSERPLASETVLLGEVGLAGELRKVARQDRREKEVAQLGYKLVHGQRTLQQLIHEAFAGSAARKKSEKSTKVETTE